MGTHNNIKKLTVLFLIALVTVIPGIIAVKPWSDQGVSAADRAFATAMLILALVAFGALIIVSIWGFFNRRRQRPV